MKKTAFAFCLAFFTLHAWATEPPANSEKPGPSLDEAKTKITERLNEHITKLEAAKICVSKATSMESLKGCRPNHEAPPQ